MRRDESEVAELNVVQEVQFSLKTPEYSLSIARNP